jgi:RNA polymerase sigma-70 factor (ECF subfamily)
VIAELVRDRGEALVRYAYLFTGDLAAAEDLLQDALVKVFLRTRTGFEPDSLDGYVRRAISTLFIDGHRKRVTWSGVQHLLVGRPQTSGPEVDVADRLDLYAALNVLTRQERCVVVLRYFEDLPVAEIAAAMGLADGSVKRYLHNAVGKLEATLGPVRAEPPDHDLQDVSVARPRRRAGRN